jgi:hypothetical protein
MKRSDKGNSLHAQIGFWHAPDGSIHLTIKGSLGGHVAVTSDPTKRNGHPTLYARLDALLNKQPEPFDPLISFVSPGGKASAPVPLSKLTKATKAIDGSN